MMKPYKKTITTLLTIAVLWAAAFMTGCPKLSEAPNHTRSEVDMPADGVYVKLERNDASSIALYGGSFTKVCENANGSTLKTGEWIFTGDDLVQLSKKNNCSVLFTVSARDADDTPLGEGTFLYDATQQKKLYVTISEDGVTCSASDAPDAAEAPSVLAQPVPDKIDRNVTIGTAGSSLLEVQADAKLLDWSETISLGMDKISGAASTWLDAKNNDLTVCLQKLELLVDEVQKLLDSAGCEAGLHFGGI